MQEILGRYELEEEIGQGGFAIVYRAHDNELDRRVALKELKPILLQDTGWVRRFRREARAIARLDHPRIVTIYDVTEVDNRLFIVMRLVDGPSLEELIAERGKLPWAETVEILAAVAEGLDYAHAQGVLHRDLKPANILMDPERGPLLTDFGLAKLAGENSMSMTASGSVVGTPHYIAPEVWEGQGAAAQADIYALGCILYELLTGEKVFKGETPPAVMMAHFKPLELPAVWPAGVPGGVSAVLKTALASRPANRYANAKKMAADLLALEITGQPSPPAAPLEPAGAAEPAETEPVAAALEAEPAEITPVPPAELPRPARPRSQPDTARRGRIGCFWIGVTVAAGLVLFVVILGGFCSTVGKVFEAALPTVVVGETATENIFVPLPGDISAPTDLSIEFGAGKLNIEPGARAGLVEGTATFNAAQLTPQVTINSHSVRIEPEKNIGLAAFTNQNIKNDWDLKLATAPLALTVEVGGAQSEIELGGLAIQDLDVSQGGANFELSFARPNQIEMGTLSFSGGASNAVLSGLANARAGNIEFKGGVGNYTLDFSGELQNDIDVSIEAGLGTITVIVPEGRAAELLVSEGQLTSINPGEAWEKINDAYVLAGTGHKIRFSAKIGGPGSINLRTE
ncbi:MAG: protein kinase [Chloroflexota bacterium]